MKVVVEVIMPISCSFVMKNICLADIFGDLWTKNFSLLGNTCRVWLQ